MSVPSARGQTLIIAGKPSAKKSGAGGDDRRDRSAQLFVKQVKIEGLPQRGGGREGP